MLKNIIRKNLTFLVRTVTGKQTHAHKQTNKQTDIDGTIITCTTQMEAIIMFHALSTLLVYIIMQQGLTLSVLYRITNGALCPWEIFPMRRVGYKICI